MGGHKKKKTRRNVTQVARETLEKIVREKPSREPIEADPESQEQDTRNPATVALGNVGASKGGKARAKKVSKKRRSEIAKKGAKARWRKKPSLALHSQAHTSRADNHANTFD